MDATTYQLALLNMAEELAKNAAKNTGAAYTAKATIVSVVDAALDLYEVTYGGNNFNAYATKGEIYSAGDVVYILIPEGNLEENRFILGASAPRATMIDTDDNNKSDTYVSISDNLFGSVADVNLRSWVDESFNIKLDTNSFETIFSDYMLNYKNFLFTARIKTEIDVDHQMKGNYGLLLNLPFYEKSTAGGDSYNQTWKVFTMDINSIEGNAYAFNEYGKVNIYFELDDTLIYDISRDPYITAFTEGFEYTTSRTDINYDIHIKDIGVEFVDVLTEADKDGYYLAVVASEGNYFLDGKYTRSKTLTPELRVKGKKTNVNKWDCYWFIEDASVDITSEYYSTIGGLGWKCINKKTNVTYDASGKQSFQYVTNQYSISISADDVKSSLRYKCVLVQDSVLVGGSVCLKNLASNIETELLSATGSSTFVENTGYVRLIARVYYPGVTDRTDSGYLLGTEWQRFDKADNYLDNDFYTVIRYNDPATITTATGAKKQAWETEIQYPCSQLEKLNTIKCTFYSQTVSNGEIVKTNLGTASLIVTTSADFTYLISMQGGDVLYKYDADGDSPMVANYDGPASSKVTTILPISYKVYKANGNELDEIEYKYCHYTWSFPKNSMMRLAGYNLSNLDQDDNYYYVSGWGESSINYTILNTFNKNKQDNSILLRVELNGNTLAAVVSPKFLKDGASGTNGTKYSAVLAYNGYAYGERDDSGKVRKLQPVYVNGLGWRLYNPANGSLVSFNYPQLSAIVYADGDRITSGYTVNWKIFDSSQTNPCFTINSSGQLSVSKNWTNVSDNYCTIVQAQIIINETSATNSKESIYAYYPIEITRLVSSGLVTKAIPNMDGGFDEVLYASDGTNPSYDNTNPFTCVDNTAVDDGGIYFTYNWAVNPKSDYSNLKLPTVTSTVNTCAVKPSSRYDNGESMNYVRVAISMSGAQRSSINTKISTLSSEITDTNNLINYYSKNKQYVLDFAKSFDYNSYVTNFKKSQDLLLNRYNAIIAVDNLSDTVDELYNYCRNNNIQTYDFDYATFRTQVKGALTGARTKLYLIGRGTSLSNLTDLSSYVPVIIDEDDIRNNRGIVTLSKIQSLILAWNQQLGKYQEYYTKLKATKSSELNNLTNLETQLVALPNNSNLAKLIVSHDGQVGSQEFTNVKQQLTTIVGKLSNTGKDIISFDSIIQKVLVPIRNIMLIYQNDAYQTNYYDTFIADYNKKLAQEQEELAGYQALLLPATSDYIIHIKPVVMLYNRYEMANLNGWDGNKLYIDENEQYIIAPQIGAGQKNSDNSFTGIVMGVKQFNNSTTQHIGLFGYSAGMQSLFLNSEDGSAIFGKSGGGQIVIDPEATVGGKPVGLLYSADFWKNFKNDGKPSSYGSSNYYKDSVGIGRGMLIDFTTPEIRFGNGNFTVSSEGHITAQGGGTIGGWEIGEVAIDGTNYQSIYSKIAANKGRMVIDSGAVYDYTDAKGQKQYKASQPGKIYTGTHNKIGATTDGFYISSDGLSIGKFFTILASGQATVTHEDSNIGQWKLTGEGDDQKLASSSNGILLDAPHSRIILGGSLGEIYSGLHTKLTETAKGFYLSNEGLSIGSKVYISSEGVMRLGNGAVTKSSTRYWEIDANTTAANSPSHIAYGDNKTFDSTDLSDASKYKIGGASNQVYIGTDGIRLGNKFAVDNAGNLVTKNLIAKNGGSIAGWEISSTALKAKGITISSNGNIEGDGQGGETWSINRGTATFNKLIASKSGEIAGWKIGTDRLSGGNMTIRSEGSLYGPNWSIAANGNAKFENITCQNVWSFGSGNNTWSNSGFSFGNGSLGGNLVNPSAFGFTKGTIGLGSATKNNNGISYDGSKCIIAGDIYANNGYFRGEIVATSGTIGGWTINSDGLSTGSFKISSNGNAAFNDLSAAKLEIGGGGGHWGDVSSEIRDLWNQVIENRKSISNIIGSYTGSCEVTIPSLSVTDGKTGSVTVKGTCSIAIS